MFKTRLISCFGIIKAPRSERVVYPIDNHSSISLRRDLNVNRYYSFTRTRRRFRPSSLNWFYDL